MLLERNRCVLVGEAPNRAGESTNLHLKLIARARGEVPEYNASPRTYAAHLRTADPILAAFASETLHLNLLETWPGKDFPLDDGIEQATVLWTTLKTSAKPRRCSVMFAGRKVARCFGVALAYWSPAELDDIRVIVVPHPSGLNRYWNLKDHRREAYAGLKREALYLRGGASPAAPGASATD